ncbi:MAG: HTH domain-containing protein [Bacteroidia bacterium]
MSLRNNVRLLERLDYLVKLKATGNPASLARRLDMSVSTLYRYLNDLKELGAPISYCKLRKTFFYEEEGRMFMGFIKKGGNKSHE